MAMRPEKIGISNLIPKERSTKKQDNEGLASTNPIIKTLTTPKQWLDAAKTGKVGFAHVLAKLDEIPTDWQDPIVAACSDRPTF